MERIREEENVFYFFKGPLIVSVSDKCSLSTLCWRKCGKSGDHSHYLLGLLQRFWLDIKEDIEKIRTAAIPLDPVLFLLGEPPQK